MPPGILFALTLWGPGQYMHAYQYMHIYAVTYLYDSLVYQSYVNWPVYKGIDGELCTDAQMVNPLRAIFFQREHKHIFAFYVIPPH